MNVRDSGRLEEKKGKRQFRSPFFSLLPLITVDDRNSSLIIPSRFLFPCMHKEQSSVLLFYSRIQIEMSSSKKKHTSRFFS